MGTATKYKIKDDNSSKVEDLFNPYSVGARPFLKWAGARDNYSINSRNFTRSNSKRKKFKGIKVMLSNSDPKDNDPSDNFFDEIYSDFNILRIPAKRMINSDPAKRGAINDILVVSLRMWLPATSHLSELLNSGLFTSIPNTIVA